MSEEKGGAQAVTRREHDLTKGAKRVISVDPFGGLITDGNYSVRIDEQEDATYIGKAQIGSSEDDSVWQIKKIITSGTTTSILWANGTDAFVNKWSDRLTVSYS